MIFSAMAAGMHRFAAGDTVITPLTEDGWSGELVAGVVASVKKHVDLSPGVDPFYWSDIVVTYTDQEGRSHMLERTNQTVHIDDDEFVGSIVAEFGEADLLQIFPEAVKNGGSDLLLYYIARFFLERKANEDAVASGLPYVQALLDLGVTPANVRIFMSTMLSHPVYGRAHRSAFWRDRGVLAAFDTQQSLLEFAITLCEVDADHMLTAQNMATLREYLESFAEVTDDMLEEIEMKAINCLRAITNAYQLGAVLRAWRREPLRLRAKIEQLLESCESCVNVLPLRRTEVSSHGSTREAA